MGFKIDGLDELQKQLKKMKKGAEDLEKTKSIPFNELFNNRFMTRYTDYESFDELLEKGGFDVKTEEDFAAIPDDIFDEYISKTTKFDTWGKMQEKAVDEFVSKKLGFK